MARERKKAPAPRAGVHALARRAKMERARQQDTTWRHLNPLKEPPKVKHKTTFELVQNADKKKKLEFKITTDRQPPPGFEFVPVGHPKLSQMCKDMSREQDAMIFIVSEGKNPDNLEHHMNRVGYHFRQTIVDHARSKLGGSTNATRAHRPGEPEPIPQEQREIDAQADDVLRDLFPRIPHTDRREIIQHAFEKDGKFHGESKVGMVKELTLARRVQLAAIAHIRHTHTRYDELLKRTTWTNARKAVEKPCLDIIVKWRGDEETGRDQLDEILREVIEISDTEEESEDETPHMEPTPIHRVTTMPAGEPSRFTAEPLPMELAVHQASQVHRRDTSVPSALMASRQKAIAKADKRTARKTQRFRRYAAAAEAIATSLDERHIDNGSTVVPSGTVPMELIRRPGSAHTIHSSREPTVAARGTPIVEQMPRHFELRTDPQRFNDGPRGERLSRVPHGLENQRPKVGHAPAGYSHAQIPLSPVRNGLQDMILQSIEPASPAPPREAQNSSRTLYREPHRFAEALRVVPRTGHESAGPISRPWSPRVMSNGNGLVTEHHRTDYPPANFGAHNGPSFIQIDRQVRGEDLRRAPTEYFFDRPQDQPRPVSGERVAHYNDDVPSRSRAHPIVIDDDLPYPPRQVVGVRRHPDDDYPVHPLKRRGLASRFPIQETTYHRGGAEIVYVDGLPDQPRSAFDYHGPIHSSSHGLAPFQDPRIRRTAATGLQRQVVEAPANYGSNHREPLRSQHPGFEPVEWSGNVHREGRAPPPGLDRPEVRYVTTQPNFQERTNFGPIADPHQDRREVRYYRLDEAREAALPQMEYRRDQPRLRAPLAHDHYMEGHGAPFRYHAPEQRMVYVDR